MIIGPSFNFIVYYLDIQIGPFQLDKLSAPGVSNYSNQSNSSFFMNVNYFKLLMAVAWIILEVLTVFFYTNLHEFSIVNKKICELGIDPDDDETAPIAINESNNTTYNSISSTQPGISHLNEDRNGNKSNEEIVEASPNKSSSINSSNGYDRIRVIDNAESGPFIVRFYNEYIRDEMVAVLATTFTVFFMQTCLEVCLSFLKAFLRCI